MRDQIFISQLRIIFYHYRLYIHERLVYKMINKFCAFVYSTVASYMPTAIGPP